MGKTIAIIGASDHQMPLVVKARNMGLRIVCFAWEKGSVCREEVDVFYPYSIVDKEVIYQACRNENISAITSIASDVAMPTVNYVAYKLGLVGNTLISTENMTNKYKMRQCLSSKGLAGPKYFYIDDRETASALSFPIIIKPVDRSGSRGVQKVYSERDYNRAVKECMEVSLCGGAIGEEYFEGRQFSVEMISQGGEHHFLGLTEEFYTGEPDFVEIQHIMPARLSQAYADRVVSETKCALDALGFSNGASHSEIRLNHKGELCFIEIAGRMGGDFRCDLVQKTSGIDFLKLTIEVALGIDIGLPKIDNTGLSASVRWVLTSEDYKLFQDNIEDSNLNIIRAQVSDLHNGQARDSSERAGYYVFTCASADKALGVTGMLDEDDVRPNL